MTLGDGSFELFLDACPFAVLGGNAGMTLDLGDMFTNFLVNIPGVLGATEPVLSLTSGAVVLPILLSGGS